MAIEFKDLVVCAETTKGVTLASGVNYTAGQVVVLQDTGKWTKAEVVLAGASATSPQLTFDKQEIGVLVEGVDCTSADGAGTVATGEFVRTYVTFDGTQVEADIAGVLNAKGIFLKGGVN